MKATQALGLALVALGLTACSCSVNSTTGTAATATTATPAITATSMATVAAAKAQVVTPAAPARPGRCVSSSLRASLGQSQGGAGTSQVALLLTNRSGLTCTLNGYPGVSFIAGADAHQIGAPAQPDLRVGATALTLLPGATVHVTIAVADYGNYDQQTCAPSQATGYRIIPPGSGGSLILNAPQRVCSKPGVRGFGTSVMLPGTISS